MPRRIETYDANLGWNFLNMLSSIGAYIAGLGVFVTVVNLFYSYRKGEIAGDNPWDGPDPRVGLLVAAARPQLRVAAADPLRAARCGTPTIPTS